jgi:hypothetical protein
MVVVSSISFPHIYIDKNNKEYICGFENNTTYVGIYSV